MRKFPISIFFFFLFSLQLSCGVFSPSLKNSNTPTHPRDLSSKDSDEAVKWKQKKWEKLAEKLYISDNVASLKEYGLDVSSPDPILEELSFKILEEKLTTPTKFLTDVSKKDEYLNYLDKVSALWQKTLHTSRCASIESIREVFPAKIPKGAKKSVAYHSQDLKNLTDIFGAPSAKVYHLSYKLQANSNGDKEALTRNGIVVIPEHGDNTAPLLLYSHGSDKGLSYLEIVNMLGRDQEKHIVIAPTFPGEALCLQEDRDETELDCKEKRHAIAAVGNGLPWSDDDVNELLGIHDCISKSISKKSFMPNQEVQRKLSQAYLPVKTGELKDKPISILIGSSRGGLVAALALAKVGASLKELGSFFKKIKDKNEMEDLELIKMSLEKMFSMVFGEAYGDFTSHFSCAAFISSPSTVLIGRFVILLEYLVKGEVEHTRFKHLPGIGKLTDIFTKYRQDKSESAELLEQAVLEIFKRDATLLSPFIMTSLKKWNYFDRISFMAGENGLPFGSMLFLHGIKDRVVPFEQAKMSVNVFNTLKTKTEILHATRTSAEQDQISSGIFIRAFQNKIGGYPFVVDHLDPSFLQSSSFLPGDLYVESKTSFRGLLSNDSEFLDKPEEDREKLKRITQKILDKATLRDRRSLSLASKLFGVTESSELTKVQREKGRLIVFGGELEKEIGYKPVGEGDIEEDVDLSPHDVFSQWRQEQCGKVIGNF